MILGCINNQTVYTEGWLATSLRTDQPILVLDAILTSYFNNFDNDEQKRQVSEDILWLKFSGLKV